MLDVGCWILDAGCGMWDVGMQKLHVRADCFAPLRSAHNDEGAVFHPQ